MITTVAEIETIKIEEKTMPSDLNDPKEKTKISKQKIRFEINASRRDTQKNIERYKKNK